jgi:hypothetical protein
MIGAESNPEGRRWLRVLTLAICAGLVPLAAVAPDTPTRQVTFSKDIAPIFQKSCQSCHHPGTAAPMSLVTYEDARPWAKAIKARTALREMPPWHLDKTVGIREYKNDISLSHEEIATIARWVDAGAPQGNLADMPPALTFRSEDEWMIGKPDLIVTTKDFTMYPAGPDWWIDQFVEIPITEDRWIKAVEQKPSNRSIVHHSVAFTMEPDEAAGPRDGAPEGGWLNEYAVGKFGNIFTENTGKLLKAGTRIRLDMHFFAIGSEQHNRQSIGFVFYPKGYVPKYQVNSLSFGNSKDLEVPPDTVSRTDAYFRLPKDALLLAFQPHMHMRGRAMTMEAINLDSTTTLLSSVDHFDFNWHVNYVYKDDVAPLLPAGSFIHTIGIHDNTSANRRNPDPSMWVGYGERSVDDMDSVHVDTVYLDHAEFERLVAERKGKQNLKSTTHNQPR